MKRLFSSVCAAVTLAVVIVGPVSAAPLVTTTGQHLSAATQPHSSGRSVLRDLVLGAALFGTIASMKDTGTIAKKFVTRAQNATQDYVSGVTGAGSRMEAAAKAAEPSWEQGVTAAVGRKAYASGLNGSGAKYDKNAGAVGGTRYGPGVQNAQDAYTKGVQPYLDRLKSLSLTPRGARGSPGNYQRSQAVATALRALKVGQ